MKRISCRQSPSQLCAHFSAVFIPMLAVFLYIILAVSNVLYLENVPVVDQTTVPDRSNPT